MVCCLAPFFNGECVERFDVLTVGKSHLYFCVAQPRDVYRGVVEKFEKEVQEDLCFLADNERLAVVNISHL